MTLEIRQRFCFAKATRHGEGAVRIMRNDIGKEGQRFQRTLSSTVPEDDSPEQPSGHGVDLISLSHPFADRSKECLRLVIVPCPVKQQGFEIGKAVLEIRGANPFRIRAYRGAVRTVQSLTRPLAEMVAEGADLTELQGIGKQVDAHIRELLQTGQLTVLDEIAQEVPRTLVELTRLDGVGPKKAKKLWDELGVESVAMLEALKQREGSHSSVPTAVRCERQRESARPNCLVADQDGLRSFRNERFLEELGRYGHL